MIRQKFEVSADNLGLGSERLSMSRPDCEGRFDLESTGRMRLHTESPLSPSDRGDRTFAKWPA